MSLGSVLVSNRGEIARRVFRSARAMGLRTVAVYVDADCDAPFVREADVAFRLETSYLDGDAILDAARRSQAGAIHPGYGFLSENADFARKVEAAGIAWVGPSPEAIETMGDKIAAKALAEKSGVPTLPMSADTTADSAVGYPLLVKAAAGGGGKGMRVVEKAADLEKAVAAAQREAKMGFGDDRVFLERFLPRARHIEIQILGDAAGNLVHLGERECSIQRRHQKIIEESPSPRVDAALREAMANAALELGRALAYRSAGTVEFLVDDASGDFWFLEVNTRLQVEHPVTEAVTGIDLVREQLRIAEGHALGFGQHEIRFEGAAVEARLYAENPARNFLPVTGTLAALDTTGAPEVRWDSGVEAGSVVGVDFDPMLAKVIAHGPTREEAALRLALSLERTHLGGMTTNRDFLVAVLRSPEFLAGDTTTDFIERVDPPRERVLDEAERHTALQLAALFVQGENRAQAPVLALLPSGWQNGRMPPQRIAFELRGETFDVAYRSRRDGRFEFLDTEGSVVAMARVHALHPGSIDAEIEGLRLHSRITRLADGLVVQLPGGDLALRQLPRFVAPGSGAAGGGLEAPMPGKVIQLLVAVGDRVRAGQTLVVLEAMKMEHPMDAPEDGVVREVLVAVGDQVKSGAPLVSLGEGDEEN
ncbi:MAG: biotin carboxylase N-terminal domain-containing protein [Myxococcota bacterium]